MTYRYYPYYALIHENSSPRKKELARRYLMQYWLVQKEYDNLWKAVGCKIFNSEAKEFPDMMFNPGYEIMPLLGGAIFDKEDFLTLQKCMQAVGDEYFIIAQALYHYQIYYEAAIRKRATPIIPRLQFKFPSNITWEELVEGEKDIDSVAGRLFGFLGGTTNFYVFGESKTWGKYVDNTNKDLDILGFLPQYASLFRSTFQEYIDKHIDQEQKEAILRSLPPAYRQYDNHLH